MSRYTQHIQTTHLGGIRYKLDAPLFWEIGKKGSGRAYIVSTGTVFDVSVPWWARWAFDPHDPRFFKAACLHDDMLSAGWFPATAAAEFYNALMANGVTRLERVVMTLAVVARTVR